MTGTIDDNKLTRFLTVFVEVIHENWKENAKSKAESNWKDHAYRRKETNKPRPDTILLVRR